MLFPALSSTSTTLVYRFVMMDQGPWKINQEESDGETVAAVLSKRQQSPGDPDLCRGLCKQLMAQHHRRRGQQCSCTPLHSARFHCSCGGPSAHSSLHRGGSLHIFGGHRPQRDPGEAGHPPEGQRRPASPPGAHDHSAPDRERGTHPDGRERPDGCSDRGC